MSTAEATKKGARGAPKGGANPTPKKGKTAASPTKRTPAEKARLAQRKQGVFVPLLDEDGDLMGTLFSEHTTSLKHRSAALKFYINQKIGYRQISFMHGSHALKHAVPLPFRNRHKCPWGRSNRHAVIVLLYLIGCTPERAVGATGPKDEAELLALVERTKEALKMDYHITESEPFALSEEGANNLISRNFNSEDPDTKEDKCPLPQPQPEEEEDEA